MSMVNPLSTTTKLLHSIIAIFMIVLLIVGWVMHEFEIFALYDLHKSFGVLVLCFAVWRILWRINKGWPEPVGSSPQFQLFIAKVVHWILITSTVLFPISGLMNSIGGGHGLSFFGIEIVAENVDTITGDAIPLNKNIADIGHEVHELLFLIVATSVILHVVGAIKHHVIDKDETLNRMFTFKK